MGHPVKVKPSLLIVVCAVVLVALLAAEIATPSETSPRAFTPLPANAGFDYQIGGDYPLPNGVSVVARDWFSGEAAADPVYSICYVNAFQTQANESGVDRPDERSNWPKGLVLDDLGDDPHWGGEYLIDIKSAAKRKRAAEWVAQMVDGCASKGYEAVEYDNLDSWTRFNETPLAGDVPFEKAEALDYAKLLATLAHDRNLAVGQKNTANLRSGEVQQVGFDFAVAEECGRYNECGSYRKLYGDRVIAIEYRRKDFVKSCEAVGEAVSVVLRDRAVSTPASNRYIYDAC